MATGPRDEPAAAGRDRLRAGHADREQVIEVLRAAFVQGRLTGDELGARAGQALAARTYADLAALTADLPAEPAAAEPAAAGPAGRPARARRHPLARAAAGSGGCLVIAFTAIWAALLLDPGTGTSPYHSWAKPLFFLAIAAVITAFGVMANGVVDSLGQKPSRGQLPPRPGAGGQSARAEGGSQPT